ncbi:hypothetical protein [Micromonospora violae]|uniref:hypothetical protein n=1 Tax=Micromonospora violae TaxID=1278207 RepID=UPI0033FA8E8D
MGATAALRGREAAEAMEDPNSARALRPLRQLTLPGGPTVLRAGLVAALLGLAAAVLQTPAGCPPTTVPSDAPSTPTSTARQGAGRPVDSGAGFPTPPGRAPTPDGSAADPASATSSPAGSGTADADSTAANGP